MIKNTLPDIAGLFSIVAPKYETITRILSFGQDQYWKKSLVELIPEKNGYSRFLDVATGTGDFASLLLTRYPDAKIVAIDLIAAMVHIARKKFFRQRILFGVQDMCALGIKNGSVDIITGGYALRNATDLPRALQEAHRVLKPSGYAAFLDFSKPSNRLFQCIEYTFLWIWGAIWGVLFHGKASVYSYIAESLKRFPDRKELQLLFHTNGFDTVASRIFFLGIIEIMVYKKKH